MTLKEAVQHLEEARWQRNAYFSRLFGLETVEDFEHIEQRDLYPSNPYYTIKLFYDPARFRTAAQRRTLRGHLAEAKARFVDRDIELCPISIASLAYRSMSLFPDTERRFVQLGYVLDVEERAKKTSRRGSLIVASHNIDVFRINAHHWGRMLLEGGTALRLWIRRPLEKEKDRLFAAMAPIMGKEACLEADKSETERINPLVEHEHMLLGAKSVEDRVVHIAYATTPGTIADHGRRVYETLFSDRSDLVEQQIAFEFAKAYRIFEGNDPPFAEAGSATRAAILTWFSQVVAAQRKVCWVLQTKQDWSLALKQLEIEKKLHAGPTGVTKMPRKMEEAQSWPELLASELDGYADNILSSIGQRPALEKIRHEVTLHDYILAALHGSTIDLGDDNEHEFFQTGSHLIALAHWIGTLKRTGEHTFDRWIARCLRVGWNEIEAGQNALLGQFPMEVWRLLLQRSVGFFPPMVVGANKLPRFDYRGFEEAKPVRMKYEWVTAETVDAAPYRAKGRSITLHGPMLCFPVHQINDWKIKAEVIRGQRGFTVRSLEG